MNKCDCYISNKYQLISNESINHFTLDELMRLVNRLKVNRSFVYSVSNLAELNEIFKYYPTKEQTVEILGGATGIVPVAQNLTDNSIDYAWLDYYTKEEVIAFINAGFIPELPAKTYVFTVNPTPATATVILNGEVRNSIVVYEGEEVTWQVEESGFTTQIGILNVTENTTIDVVLDEVETGGGGSEDPVPVYTVCIEPTPSDATVLINNELQSCYSGPSGSVVTYTVARTGYVSQNGTIQVNGNKTVQVVLEEKQEEEKYFTLRINPTPSNATVKINGIETNELTVQAYTYVEWSVSADGYISDGGTIGMNRDITLSIALERIPNYYPDYTFTINPTPSNATVIINGSERKSYIAKAGDIVSWSVSLNGYVSQSGSYIMGESDYTMNINLEVYVPPTYTLTIVPVPADAEVFVHGEWRNSVTVEAGTSVRYLVRKEGYYTVEETVVVNSDLTLTVKLVEIPYFTFTINPTPSNATVKIDGFRQSSVRVVKDTVVEWSVSADGYYSKSGSVTVTNDITMSVVLIQDGVTFTIVPIPSDATVVINGEVRNTIFVERGTSVEWSVSADGYGSSYGGTTVYDNQTMFVNLSPTLYRLTINPTPSDATVYIDGEVRKYSNTVPTGTKLSWTVVKDGYDTQSGVYVIDNDDYTMNVILEESGDCNPQLITTSSQYSNMGYTDSEGKVVVDECHYDLSEYTGNISNLFGSYLNSDIQVFEGNMTQNGNRTSLARAFLGRHLLESVPYVGDVYNVTDLTALFAECYVLAEKPSWVGYDLFEGVTSCRDMFAFTPCDVEIYNVYMPCSDMSYMFYNSNGKTVSLTDWRIQNVDSCNMTSMFSNSQLENIKLDMAFECDVNAFNLIQFSDKLETVDINMTFNKENAEVNFERAFNLYGTVAPLKRFTLHLSDSSKNLNINFKEAFIGIASDVIDFGDTYSSSSLYVTNFFEAFYASDRVEDVSLTMFNFSKCTNASYCFNECSNLRSVTFRNAFNIDCSCEGMFKNIETTGTLYYPSEYADTYVNVIAEIPSTWTAVAY